MTEREISKLLMARHRLSHILWFDKYYDKATARVDVSDALKLIEEILKGQK